MRCVTLTQDLHPVMRPLLAGVGEGVLKGNAKGICIAFYGLIEP